MYEIMLLILFSLYNAPFKIIFLISIKFNFYLFFQYPAFQNLQHPEIHRAMLQDGLLVKSMQFLLNSINSPLHFTITDVIAPTVARHRQFLTVMIDCMVLAQKTDDMFAIAYDKQQAREEKLQKLRDEVNHLQNYKTQLLHDRGVREEKVKDVSLFVFAIHKRTDF
jgi:hypothetical protein